MTVTGTEKPRGLALMFGWRRVRFTLAFAGALGVIFGFGWQPNMLSLVLRTMTIGLVAMIAFGIIEQWPRRLPRWCLRWVLQVIAVAVSVPPTVVAIYVWSTPEGSPPFYREGRRLEGFGMLMVMGLFFAPWAALGALVRQKEGLVEAQALAFDLERSELGRQALDARLRLLQAQVAPHFLFNTLANVQALVDAGSPQAAAVLRSLVAYLRAAVPRLHEPVTTLAQEIDLVTAYLELMHMRMPDRLQFALNVDASARVLTCPPMTLLTLVENAVRHGIDPSEEGGRIDVTVERRGQRCRIVVADTGLGLSSSHGLGTGLATLRERLELIFGDAATLRLTERWPRGVTAEVQIPAQERAA